MNDNNINTKNRRNFFFPRNTQYQELDDFLRLNLPSDIYFNPVDENLKKTTRLFSGCDAFEPTHIVYLLVIFKLYGKEFENAYDFISTYGLKTNIYIHQINIIDEWYDKFKETYISDNPLFANSNYEIIFEIMKSEFIKYWNMINYIQSNNYYKENCNILKKPEKS